MRNSSFHFFYFGKDSAIQAIFFVIYHLKNLLLILLHPHTFLFQINVQILSVSMLIFHSCELILVNKEQEYFLCM